MAEVGDLFRDAGFTVPNAKAPWAVMAKNSPDYRGKIPHYRNIWFSAANGLPPSRRR